MAEKFGAVQESEVDMSDDFDLIDLPKIVNVDIDTNKIKIPDAIFMRVSGEPGKTVRINDFPERLTGLPTYKDTTPLPYMDIKMKEFFGG